MLDQFISYKKDTQDVVDPTFYVQVPILLHDWASFFVQSPLDSYFKKNSALFLIF